MKPNEAIFDRLNDIAVKICDLNNTLAEEHNKTMQGNKAASVRARKATLEVEKLCKEYRKLSIEAFK